MKHPSSSPSGVKAVLSFSWKCRKQFFAVGYSFRWLRRPRIFHFFPSSFPTFFFLSFFLSSFFSSSILLSLLLSPHLSLSLSLPSGFITRERKETTNFMESSNGRVDRWLLLGLKDYPKGYLQWIGIMTVAPWEEEVCSLNFVYSISVKR